MPESCPRGSLGRGFDEFRIIVQLEELKSVPLEQTKIDHQRQRRPQRDHQAPEPPASAAFRHRVLDATTFFIKTPEVISAAIVTGATPLTDLNAEFPSLLPAAPESAVKLHDRVQLRPARAREQNLLIEELLVGDQNLEVVRKPGLIT